MASKRRQAMVDDRYVRETFNSLETKLARRRGRSSIGGWWRLTCLRSNPGGNCPAKARHAPTIAGPLSRRKSAMVFEVGDKPAQQPHRLDMRWHSRFKRRDERISLK
jgi:hypothetical protein